MRVLLIGASGAFGRRLAGFLAQEPGIALVLAGLSTYYFLRDPLPDSEGRVLKARDWTLNPYIGPNGAGSHFDVRF